MLRRRFLRRNPCKCQADQCCWRPAPIAQPIDVADLFARLHLVVDQGAADALGISR